MGRPECTAAHLRPDHIHSPRLVSMPHERSGPPLPQYVQMLREDAHPEVRASFMHVGYWSKPNQRPLAYGVYLAQRRLAEYVIETAGIRNGYTVLDIGCGFGGISQLIDEQYTSVRAIGLDIHTMQLHVCSSLSPRPGNRLLWTYGDAVSMPFKDGTADAIISVEAAMHFRSREAFFAETARLLRPNGRLAMVDILLDVDAARSRGLTVSSILDILAPDFTPLPELDTELADLLACASRSGLRCVEAIDITENTLPTYSPDAYDEFPPGMMTLGSQNSIQLFVDLHRAHIINMHLLAFVVA